MGPYLHDGLRRTARRTPHATALTLEDQCWTFAELDAAADVLADHLHGLGVLAGDRVALMCGNRPEFFVAVQAVSRAGAASVLLSPAWRSAEVDHALALTDPVLGLAEGDSIVALRGLPLGAVELDALADLPPSDVAHLAAVDEHAESVLVFSSGTTGLPKAVRHTHSTMGAAVSQWVSALGLTDVDRLQVTTPPTHILGLLNLLAAAEAGAWVRLHRRFDLDTVLGCIEADRITLEMAVAPIALAMANHWGLAERDLSSLRYIMWGATPVTVSVAEQVTDRTGVRWLPAYGASECPVITANPVTRPQDWRLDSAGLPADGVRLRVVDLETGAVLASGGTGEVQVRSASVMAGYLPAAADAEAFVDGWYRTGDVGWIEPGGWLHLTDRSKEMIKVNGFQVAPAEVEAVLLGHPAVLDCAVFGVPDERMGEVPVAAVTLDPTHHVDVGDLQRLVAETLATYKRVHHVVVVDEVPRLASGKVLRRALREQWLAGTTAAV
jgi:long-chain acyl-CoA synthetase